MGRKPDWDERIERAAILAYAYPFAADVLHFYGELTQWQKGFYESLERHLPTPPAEPSQGRLREELPLEWLLPAFPSLLAFCERRGPAGLARLARELAQAGEGRWVELLVAYWAAETPGQLLEQQPESVIARMLLQPYAEWRTDHASPPQPMGTPRRCPYCGSLPQLSVLRPEGDGARRCLLCSLCLQEWDYRRLVCAYCGEESDPKLPVFTTEALPHLRVEACESCKAYLTGVNLAQDGRAVPVVDELAGIPLRLWAEQQGYHRGMPNLLGV